MPKVTLNLVVDEDMYDWIDEKKDKMGLTRSETVRRMFKKLMDLEWAEEVLEEIK